MSTITIMHHFERIGVRPPTVYQETQIPEQSLTTQNRTKSSEQKQLNCVEKCKIDRLWTGKDGMTVRLRRKLIPPRYRSWSRLMISREKSKYLRLQLTFINLKFKVFNFNPDLLNQLSSRLDSDSVYNPINTKWIRFLLVNWNGGIMIALIDSLTSYRLVIAPGQQVINNCRMFLSRDFGIF